MDGHYFLVFGPAGRPVGTDEPVGGTCGRAAFCGWVRGLAPGEAGAFEEEIDHGVRKAAHFTEYAILGLLLTAMYRAYGHEGKRLFLLAAGTGSLYASTDEFHQLFVQGRSCQITDWMIDTCGVAAGGAVMYLICRLQSKGGEEGGSL